MGSGYGQERRWRRCRADDGASMVEFALVLPLFMALVMGVFSGGILFNQKLTMTNAAREGSRYAATLPVEGVVSMNAWLDSVAEVAVNAASGELAVAVPGRAVCVAYVHPAGSTANDRTTKRVQRLTGPPAYSVGPSERCFADTRPTTERRVQVQVQRRGSLDAIVFSADPLLNASSVARFEATPLS